MVVILFIDFHEYRPEGEGSFLYIDFPEYRSAGEGSVLYSQYRLTLRSIGLRERARF